MVMLVVLCLLVMVFAIPTANAANYSKVYGQTQSRVRVRESASTNAAIIDNIVKHACVYITSTSTRGANTFVRVKYRAENGDVAEGWVCQNDGKETYVKVLSADQAKKAFSVSGGKLPTKRVGTFTETERKASLKDADSTYIKGGSDGEAVKNVQTKLKALKYYSGQITGHVGDKTKEAIRKFQRDHGLTADGIVGPQTMAKIDAVYASKGGAVAPSGNGSNLKLNSSGPSVRNLQQDLTMLGYYWAQITGNFGAKTEAAVKAFQKDHGLTADGVAGKKTLEAVRRAVEKKGGSSSSSNNNGSVLKLNSQGTKVSQMQRDLKQLGYYYAEVTGNFGAKTEAAVKKFQKDKGLYADGVAGSKTLDAIAKAVGNAGGSISGNSSIPGLKLGSTGDQVRALQQDLTTLGYYYGDITGHYGNMTATAVKKFQRARGLSQDGVAGKTTLDAIVSALKANGSDSATGGAAIGTLREGDKGREVTDLQTRLKSLGYYYGEITGSFGSLTKKAVRSFQQKNGLTVDGVAGPATLNKLRSMTGGGSSSGSSTGGTTVTTENSYGRITKDNVYLRSSYSTTSSAKTSLKKGTKVRITKTYTVSGVKWYYVVVHQGKYTYKGYVRSDMMEMISANDYGEGAEGNADDQEVLGMIRVTGNNVALRYEPNTDANRVSTANTGDVFYYVDSVEGWYQTKNGYWISSSYAKVMSEQEIKDYIGSGGATGDDTYRYGSTGSMVSYIQTALKKLEYYSAQVTGRFGAKTEQAVKDFQRDHGLTADGIVGPKTLEILRREYSGKSDATTTYNDVIYNVDWSIVKSKLKKRQIVKLTDINSGLSFNVDVQSAGNHADVEPVTAADTVTMCEIYGVNSANQIKWYRHAMIMTIGNEQFITSVYGTPHGQQNIGASNQFEGQFCVHFKGSSIHAGDGGNVPASENHQAVISNAAKELNGKKIGDKTITVKSTYP